MQLSHESTGSFVEHHMMSCCVKVGRICIVSGSSFQKVKAGVLEKQGGVVQ
jgi:hypothetical protein